MAHIFGKTIQTPFGEVFFSRITTAMITTLPLQLFVPTTLIVLVDMNGFSGIVSSLLMSVAAYFVLWYYRRDAYSRLCRWRFASFDAFTKTYIYITAIGFEVMMYSRSMLPLILYLLLAFMYIVEIGMNNILLNKELYVEEADYGEYKTKPAPLDAFRYKFFAFLVLSIWMIAWSFDFKSVPVDTSVKYVKIDILPPSLEQIKAAESSSVHSVAGLDDMVRFCSGGDESSCAYASGIYLSSKDPALYPKAFLMLEFSCSDGSLVGCSNLAAMYALGLGREKNLVKAKELYTYSCSKGAEDACDNLMKVENGLNAIAASGVAAQKKP